MQNVWLVSSVWLGLALAASIISIRVAISVALIEIMVGAIAGNTIGLTSRVGQLSGWLRRDHAHVSGRHGDRQPVMRKHFGPSMASAW